MVAGLAYVYFVGGILENHLFSFKFMIIFYILKKDNLNFLS